MILICLSVPHGDCRAGARSVFTWRLIPDSCHMAPQRHLAARPCNVDLLSWKASESGSFSYASEVQPSGR